MTAAPPFVPLCMEPDELVGWEAHQRTAANARGGRAVSPCYDCLKPFSDEMRAIGRCNGVPGGVEPDEEPFQIGIAPPDCQLCGHRAGTHRRLESGGRMVCRTCQHNGRRNYLHEYEPESPARKERHMGTVTTRVQVSAPCGNCLHAPVCARKTAIDELAGQVDVDSETRLPDGLSVALVASIDCDAYLRDKSHHAIAEVGPHGDGRSKPRTPAQQAVLERMREARAEKLRLAAVESAG